MSLIETGRALVRCVPARIGVATGLVIVGAGTCWLLPLPRWIRADIKMLPTPSLVPARGTGTATAGSTAGPSPGGAGLLHGRPHPALTATDGTMSEYSSTARACAWRVRMPAFEVKPGRTRT